MNEYKFICNRCGKEFKLLLTEYQYTTGKHRKFCSLSCSNTRIHSDKTKQKIKDSIDKQKIKRTKIRICKVCGKEFINNKQLFPGCTKIFCSDQCSKYYRLNRKVFLSNESLKKLSEAGIKSAKIQSEERRSKNEIYFYNLCKKYFNNVEHNKNIFNGWDADIIIEDIKFAILWNGKWHYEQICKKHSVKMVQNRDKLKISNIKNCGYIPYIIKDMGKFNENFVQEKFNEFILFLKINNYITD